ncbi:diguanylate cyclase with PAS/PAC sensor [Candidatus Koribacter versatilis Ellin345]|uniref:Diguanylate cyclase with PAS/PAC sensor n=1 Tax=Koribacter versatilis (strain Ellin345) TaxID=204669 RepID=Q1IKW9_KORVE|nr:PAS domain-containing protein [Candidatus Koribacter versatilis]ABF42481.1 diguanylate cyclase with PAS/PAC sensor [Candidatus Koribacter versatilis Ellin345]
MADLLQDGVFQRVLSELLVGVYFTDRERRIVFWNAGAERITGYLSHEVIGRMCREEILMHCDHQRRNVCVSCCPLAEAMLDGKAREASLFLRHKTGHRVPVRIHSMPIRDAKGTIIGAAECFQRQHDVWHPERRDANNRDSYAVRGIPDYSFMVSELRMRLGRFEGSGAGFGVLCLEVDRFDSLRSTRGHEACETVLHVISNTLQNTIRQGDCLGAWSEARLMLLLNAATPEAVVRAGERTRGLVSCSNVTWWGDPVPITIACGATVAKTRDTMESIVRRAERALDESLAAGGNRVMLIQE